MSDRELLEWAAKAAGMKTDGLASRYLADAGPRSLLILNDRGGHTAWNPLTDDGDALRLAVKLQLTVCNEHLSAGGVYCTNETYVDFPDVRSGRIGLDPEVIPEDYAATRRAIVLAAAEIGKATASAGEGGNA